MTELQGSWFEFEGNDDAPALWKISFFVSKELDVYMPAALFMNERRAFLIASFDGESVIEKDGHMYAKSQWLLPNAQEQDRDLIEGLRDKILEANS